MSEATTAPTIHTRPALRVSWRPVWTDDWQELADAEPRSVRLTAAPGMDEAIVAYRYGRLIRPGGSGWVTAAPISLIGGYLKIETLAEPVGENPAGADELLFIGTVPGEQYELDAALEISGSPVASGLHVARALGFEELLNRQRVTTAVVSLKRSVFQAEVQRIGVALAFNDRDAVGLGRTGNCSTAPREFAGWTSHVFEQAATGAATVWTLRLIAEYLIAEVNRTFQATPGALPVFALGGQVEMLEQVAPPRMDLTGLTIQQALSKVIARERGANWCLRYNASTDIVSVHVFSELAAAIQDAEGTTIVPANTQPQSLDLDNLDRVDGRPSLVYDQAATADRIIVRGAPVVSCFSVQASDATLEPLWTPTEEAAYAAADETARTSDALRHVWTTYWIPPDADPWPDWSPRLSAAGEIEPGETAPIRRWGRKLLRQLPLLKEWGLDGVEAEYLEPFVVCQPPPAEGESARWVLADRLDAIGLTSYSLRLLDTEPGFELLANPNHLLALNHMTEAAAGDVQPEIDHQTLLATVAMATDAALQVTVQMVDPLPPAPRDLVLDVPDAQLWWIRAGTVAGVDDDGTLIRQISDQVLRSDAARLRNIAYVAAAWYGRRRAQLTCQLRRLSLTPGVGQLITATLSGGYASSVNTCVTTVELDLVTQRTTIRTDFADLNPMEIVT